MPQKNQKMLLEAFARIKDEFPDYCLTIYGDGPEYKNLFQKACSLGIQDRFFLPGNVREIFEGISKSKLFVLCSNYEGMPNALIEAMCLGLPCISTLVSGVEDLIVPGINGEIVPVGDIEYLVTCMRRMLSSQDLLDIYASNAIDTNAKLAVDLITSQWIKYLEAI